jgi:(2R)-sulfolactate sulfo-lyase subunit alpha
MKSKVLIHNHGDHVGVATDDIAKGEEVICVFMDKKEEIKVKSGSEIPLGHKLALKAIPPKDKVVEYGAIIGIATSSIDVGEHVHTHNLRSLRL